MKKIGQGTIRVLFMSLVVLMMSCNQGPQKAAKESDSTSQKEDLLTTSTGKKVYKAEKGITVVNPNGWTSDQMEFQQRYCESMMASLEEIEGWKFCECFLDRIQYYYKPIHFKEAYDDQQKWNSECYQKATK